MNQSKHFFQFKASDIAQACAKEVAYRRARIAHWEAIQQQQKERAKNLTATVEIKEWEHSSGREIQVVAVLVDVQDINSILTRASQKLNEHRPKVLEYELKANVYRSQGDRVYDLDPDDVVYFRLDGAAPRE